MKKISKMHLINNFFKPFIRVNVFRILSKLFSRIQDIFVTIFIVHGKEKQSQSDISILFFGKKDSLAYLSEIVYENDPTIERISTIFIWGIKRKLNYYSKDVDMVVVKTDRFFSNFLNKKGFIIIPEWIEMSMTIPGNFQNLFETLGSSAKKDMQTIQKYDFSYEISNDPEKLDFFYFKMCLPYMMKRHGKLALFNLIDYEDVNRNFRRGFLLFVKENEKYIAGSVIIMRKKVAYPVYMGILDDDLYLHQSVGASLYYFPLIWANKNNIKKINFGNTRTFLNSGDFQFKRKWGMTVENSNVFFGIYGLKMIPNSADKVMNLLENHPTIYTNGVDLKGLVVRQQPLTSQNIDTIWKNYFTEGLSYISIFSPYCFENKLKETVRSRYKDRIILLNTMEKIN
jgi:hypothetical protein